MLPPSVEDYVPEDHPVRVIDAFVDSLKLPEMGFRKAQTARTGRRPYHPGNLLKLYIYAYLNQTSSTRRLEKKCHRNLEVLWLMKQLAPDFKTIADFRKDNGDAVKKVCRQFIVFCKQAGLVSGRLVAIDASKFKAAASKDQAITRKQLQKQLGKLDQKIDGYLEQLAASEQEGEPDLNNEKVTEALACLEAHKAELQDELKILVEEGKTQHCRTESDAKLMKSGREGSDNQQLEPIAQATLEALDYDLKTVVADAGYSNGDQISRSQSSGLEVGVPSNRAVNNQGTGEYFQKRDFTVRRQLG